MAVEVRELGARLGAPVGAVLEGGYSPPALADSVAATMRGLGGEGDPVTAPETARRRRSRRPRRPLLAGGGRRFRRA